MAQLVAALITVHGLLSFLSDVYDREPERFTRWIKEAIHIRKEEQQAMNRDEGSYQLSHAYDRFHDTASSRCVKNRKNWVPASSDEDLWQAETSSF